jgi:hypothetical protein
MAVSAPPPPKVEIDDGVIEEARRRQRRRWALSGTAVAVAIAALVLALLFVGGGSGSVYSRGPLLRVSAQAGVLMPPRGHYLYVESRSQLPLGWSSGGTSCKMRILREVQIWTGATGSGLERIALKRAPFPAGQAGCLRLSRLPGTPPVGAGSSSAWFAPNCLGLLGPTFNWSRLSTDPQVLLRQLPRILGVAARPAPVVESANIVLFLSAFDAPQAIRRATYSAAALIPGVRPVRLVRDHGGRFGLGLALARPDGSTDELIFDRRTWQLTGEQGSARAGLAGSWTAYQPIRIVSALPATPPASLTPACAVPGWNHFRTTEAGQVVTGAA